MSTFFRRSRPDASEADGASGGEGEVEGVLWKLGDKGIGRKIWRKRLFRAHNGRLYYYKPTDRDWSKPLGLIALEKVMEIKPAFVHVGIVPAGARSDSIFALVSESRNTFLMTSNKAAMSRWIERLWEIKARWADMTNLPDDDSAAQDDPYDDDEVDDDDGTAAAADVKVTVDLDALDDAIQDDGLAKPSHAAGSTMDNVVLSPAIDGAVCADDFAATTGADEVPAPPTASEPVVEAPAAPASVSVYWDHDAPLAGNAEDNPRLRLFRQSRVFPSFQVPHGARVAQVLQAFFKAFPIAFSDLAELDDGQVLAEMDRRYHVYAVRRSVCVRLSLLHALDSDDVTLAFCLESSKAPYVVNLVPGGPEIVLAAPDATVADVLGERALRARLARMSQAVPTDETLQLLVSVGDKVLVPSMRLNRVVLPASAELQLRFAPADTPARLETPPPSPLKEEPARAPAPLLPARPTPFMSSRSISFGQGLDDDSGAVEARTSSPASGHMLDVVESSSVSRTSPAPDEAALQRKSSSDALKRTIDSSLTQANNSTKLLQIKAPAVLRVVLMKAAANSPTKAIHRIALSGVILQLVEGLWEITEPGDLALVHENETAVAAEAGVERFELNPGELVALFSPTSKSWTLCLPSPKTPALQHQPQQQASVAMSTQASVPRLSIAAPQPSAHGSMLESPLVPSSPSPASSVESAFAAQLAQGDTFVRQLGRAVGLLLAQIKRVSSTGAEEPPNEAESADASRELMHGRTSEDSDASSVSSGSHSRAGNGNQPARTTNKRLVRRALFDACNDSINTRIGLAVRGQFCTALAACITYGLVLDQPTQHSMLENAAAAVVSSFKTSLPALASMIGPAPVGYTGNPPPRNTLAHATSLWDFVRSATLASFPYDSSTNSEREVSTAWLNSIAQLDSDKALGSDDNRKFRCFVCQLLNSQSLIAWIRTVLQHPPLLGFHFVDWALVRQPQLRQNLIAILDPINGMPWNLALYFELQLPSEPAAPAEPAVSAAAKLSAIAAAAEERPATNSFMSTTAAAMERFKQMSESSKQLISDSSKQLMAKVADTTASLSPDPLVQKLSNFMPTQPSRSAAAMQIVERCFVDLRRVPGAPLGLQLVPEQRSFRVLAAITLSLDRKQRREESFGSFGSDDEGDAQEPERELTFSGEVIAVRGVVPQTPAAAAGLVQPGDIVESVNGTDVLRQTVNQAANLLQQETLHLTLLRSLQSPLMSPAPGVESPVIEAERKPSGVAASLSRLKERISLPKRQSSVASVAASVAPAPAPSTPSNWVYQEVELTKMTDGFGLDLVARAGGGLVVQAIQRGGAAWHANCLEVGDLIVRINGNSILAKTHTEAIAMLRATVTARLSIIPKSQQH